MASNRYHINPKTGNANLCKAKVACPFGGEEAHHDSKEQARQAYEAAQGSAGLASKSKLPLVKPGQPNPLLAEAVLSDKVSAYDGKPSRCRDGGRYLFLTVRGIHVAAVKVYDDNDRLSLCDIETRPEYRRQGYAGKLLEQVAELYNVEKVPHTGGYTADGFNYVSKLLDRSLTSSPASIEYPEYDDANPFSVIEDWDSQLTKYDG